LKGSERKGIEYRLRVEERKKERGEKRFLLPFYTRKWVTHASPLQSNDSKKERGKGEQRANQNVRQEGEEEKGNLTKCWPNLIRKNKSQPFLPNLNREDSGKRQGTRGI